MKIPFFTIKSLAGADEFRVLLAGRADPEEGAGAGFSVEKRVAEILSDVRGGGLEALLSYTRKYDSPAFRAEQFALSPSELEQSARSIPGEDREILRQSIENVRVFHLAQKEESRFITRRDGSLLGQMLLPVGRAGLYVPGGKGGDTPLISSLIMGAVPALVAGVAEIAVISPPRADGTLNPYIPAVAHMLGLTEVYAAGGAWAIAALAYGAGSLQAVDVIAGPGNIYVAAAKRLLIGRVGIDMIAGPSEICIVADASANPAWIAADMLSQAEHDALASAVLICTDRDLGRAVASELERQCQALPRRERAESALTDFGAIFCVPNLDLAMQLANSIAPEHLELALADAWSCLPLVRNAGAVFIGQYAAEVFGDYYAGPNHVLPTMGTARFSSALSVSTFCKKSSIIAVSNNFAAQNAAAVARLARLEGLEAHARAALCRLEGQSGL
ncbi:MAG: histidinol dehydrogenase [Desulfovibrio sp.]|jgi:histidinol dehydrogenase|nr:histidinol dehydrogenase [Desulfovibrio sp.]